MRAYVLIAALVFLMASCDRDATDKPGPVPEPQVLAEIYAREPCDSASYRHIKYDFFRSSTGQLCERKLMLASDRDSSCKCEFIVYYDTAFRIYRHDSLYEVPLGLIIDLDSYEVLGSSNYSKDNNRVYYFHANSDGGIRTIIEGADPKTFRNLCEYRWGIDKSFVYYKDEKLEGLHLKKLRVLYPSDSASAIVNYVKDDRVVYENGEILSGADAETFRLVEGKGWQAEDKNYRYEAGGRRSSYRP